jgi:hypothetical protein
MHIKKIQKISLTALSILFFSQIQCMESDDAYFYYNFSKNVQMPALLERHTVNDELKAKLDTILRLKQYKVISSGNQYKESTFETLETSELPNYMIKTNDPTRIVGALLINECAQRYGLAVYAPHKQYYTDASGMPYVIAPKIKSSNEPFSLKQIQGMYTIIEKTGFEDLPSNIINTEDGVVCIIDTQKRSFSPDPNFHTARFPSQYGGRCFLVALNYLSFLYSQEDAVCWLRQKIRETEQKISCKSSL